MTISYLRNTNSMPKGIKKQAKRIDYHFSYLFRMEFQVADIAPIYVRITIDRTDSNTPIQVRCR